MGGNTRYAIQSLLSAEDAFPTIF